MISENVHIQCDIQGLKIALAQSPGLVFLTAELPILSYAMPDRLVWKKFG